MFKKVSDKQKKEISDLFIKGSSIKDISNIYKFSLQTITRQLKISLGDNEFKRIKTLIKSNLENKKKENAGLDKLTENLDEFNFASEKQNVKNNNFLNERFFEVVPIANPIDFDNQKDLTSEPLKDANLPQVLYLLVDNKIELAPKLLKDYPEWSFLPETDLSRKTIRIFSDPKEAKKYCSKNQKAIKIPNSKVFFLVKDSLKKKGISRIIFNDSLLSF